MSDTNPPAKRTFRDGLKELMDEAFETYAVISCGVFVIAIFAAGGIALVRFLYLMKTDYWIASSCEAMTYTKYDVSEWCNISTQWKGFDRLYNYIVGVADVSLVLALSGFLFFVVTLGAFLWFVSLLQRS